MNNGHVLFSSEDIMADISENDSIATLASKYHVRLYQPCGGQGQCGKCKVIINNINTFPTESELRLLSADELNRGVRLACQTKATDGLIVNSLNYDSYIQILDSAGKRNISYKNNKDTSLGIAIDIGTTTLVIYLVNKNSGDIICTVSDLNPQIVYGDDVISRISYVGNNYDGLQQMQHCLIQEINQMIAQIINIANISKEQIYEVVVAGNTTMEHIFAGVSPVSIGKAPYAPEFYIAPLMYASDLNLSSLAKQTKIILVPNIYGFVGGDIVAGIIYSEMYKSNELSLLLDIGTNNEMVLGNKDYMLCCSAAAGPALEGAKISNGMRASAGAIDKVKINNNNLQINTIANEEAVGICGSGLVDIIAVLISKGIILKSGKFAELSRMDPVLSKRFNFEHKYFVLSTTKGNKVIYLSQKDVREVQLAKGAIATGINIMLEVAKKTINDIDKIYLAGAFGNYLDVNNAMITGILPSAPIKKIISIGNSSGLGAIKLLSNNELWEFAYNISKNTKHIELALFDNFKELFVKNLIF